MKVVKTFFIFSLLFLNIFSFLGQNLKKHQWKDRILLVISSDKNSDDFKNQLQLLKDKKSGYKERKLIVYCISKDNYNINFSKNKIISTKLFSKYNKEKVSFKAILIGLDGGIKLDQKSILYVEKLFAIIDGMPMRKSKLRNYKR